MPKKTVRHRKSKKRADKAVQTKPTRPTKRFASAGSRYPATDSYNGMRGENFGAGWKFHLGDADGGDDAACDDSGWRRLDLPHDWSIELPFHADSPAGTGGGFLDGGVGWYRKTFTAPADWRGKRVFVGFDGAYMNSRVWLNGTLLGERPYGYISFEYELTPHLRLGARNTLSVRLDNNQPNSRWYSGSGIYRNVWLTVLDPLHADYCGLSVTTPAAGTDSATVRIRLRVRNQSAAARSASIRVRIFDPDGKRVAAQTSAGGDIRAEECRDYDLEVTVANPRLWSVNSPNRYSVRVEVLSGGAVTDTYQATFGIRTFAMDPDEGFSLNGVRMKLNGVCLHHDLGALGAAVNRRATERQLQIMMATGCNAVRTSHNPPEPELLDLCDRLGLLVIDEAFDTWKESKNANDYNLYFDRWARIDIQAMVRRDRNHPCIVMYSIGNEIHDVVSEEGVPRAQRLIEWVRQEDTTRLMTHGSNFNEWGTAVAGLLDTVGYNYHTHLYDLHHAQYPRWRMYASETSSSVRSRGVYKPPTGERLPPGADFQCSSYDNTVADWGLSAEESYKQVNTRKFIAGEFLWSGFDYLGEPTPYGWPAKSSYFGIVDTCGFPKDIYYFYQSRWTDRPMVHLLPHWNWSEGETVAVWAYTNCEEVELFLNNLSLGVRRFEPNGPLHLEWKVPFRPGTLRAEARRGGSVAARDEVRTAGAPVAVRLSTDRSELSASNEDLAFVTADIIDSEGVICPAVDNRVNFSVTGPGMIAGVDNGDPVCHESYKGTGRSAFHGKCLAIVRSTGRPGKITIAAAADGLAAGLISLQAVNRYLHRRRK
jgi:beta-galactosidase